MSSLLDGQLAWRQHDGGHTDGPNWKYFIPWADGFFKRPYTGGGALVRAVAADQPVPRTDANSLIGARAAAREGEEGRDRRLLRRRLDHAAVGRDRLSGTAGQLEAEFLRLERGGLRLGRGPDPEHSLAAGERRAGRRESEGDRAAGGDEQRRQRGSRRARRTRWSRTSPRAAGGGGGDAEAKRPTRP